MYEDTVSLVCELYQARDNVKIWYTLPVWKFFFGSFFEFVMYQNLIFDCITYSDWSIFDTHLHEVFDNLEMQTSNLESRCGYLFQFAFNHSCFQSVTILTSAAMFCYWIIRNLL